MKANEAPEKIYIDANEDWHRTYTAFAEKAKGNDIEYIRTDTFIDKACEWLRKNADNYTWYDESEGESGMIDGFIEVFRGYMKGE